jgi:hypothetical protein
MATRIPYTYPGCGIEVVDRDLSFERALNGRDVELIVERDGREFYITISREDWLAIIEHLS